MEYTNLGKSGLKVSRICLGCMSYGDPKKGHHSWVLNEEESHPFIKRALELGINFFDTANMYSEGESERVIGKILKDFGKRDELVIATKSLFSVAKRSEWNRSFAKNDLHRDRSESQAVGDRLCRSLLEELYIPHPVTGLTLAPTK